MDQLLLHLTNNSVAAILELSKVITLVPSSMDPPPSSTKISVASALAATSPSFVLSAQDLSQAFS